MYLGFGFSYIEGGPWSDGGIKSVHKYLERVERLAMRSLELSGKKAPGKEEKELDYVLHNTIKSVGADIEVFSFNTAIARMMELTNASYRYLDGQADAEYLRGVVKTLLLLLAPFAPHFCEELWGKNGRRIQHL